MSIKNNQFESDFGFKSPNFVVDEMGNIRARSLSLAESNDVAEIPPDINIEEKDGNFFINDQTTPELVFERGRRYIIDISLTNLDISFYESTFNLYTAGLVDVESGPVSSIEQNKKEGRLIYDVPLTAPDELFYKSSTSETFNPINIVNQNVKFNRIDVESTVDALDISTGAIVVDGGVAINKSLRVNAKIHASDISDITTVTLTETDTLALKTHDDITIGEINNQGLSMPVIDTTIENTKIGLQSPTTARFTSASVDNKPSDTNDVTNKKYVDNSITALSIALGT